MNMFFKNTTLQFGFISLTALISINLWSFQGIDGGMYRIMEAAVLLGMVIVVLFKSSILIKKNLNFKANVHLFIWLPFLSAFGAYLYHEQSFQLSFILLRANFFWLFYFVLHIFEVPKKKLIQLMIFIGCVWALITILQQFTYPTAYFFTRDGESKSILRAGVYRFMITGHQYGLFVLIYFFYQYLISTSRTKIYKLFFVGLGLLGFYYFGTRQFAAAAVLTMGVAILYLRPALRAKYIALMIPVVLVMLLFKDALFGDYIEMTNQQMEFGDEDIRALSASFWLNDYWPHWVTKIIGNGPPHMLSNYGRENEFIISYLHFYRSDVGIIGTYNKYGILYALNIIWVSLRAITIKIPDVKDRYLKILFFNVIFLIVTNESYSNDGVMPYYSFVMYLIDKSIEVYKNRRVEAEQLEALPA